MIRLLKSFGIRIVRGLTSHDQKILRDGKEPTHYLQRVGHEVSGDMVLGGLSQKYFSFMGPRESREVCCVRETHAQVHRYHAALPSC